MCASLLRVLIFFCDLYIYFSLSISQFLLPFVNNQKDFLTVFSPFDCFFQITVNSIIKFDLKRQCNKEKMLSTTHLDYRDEVS